MDARQATMAFDVTAEPVSVTIDPSTWLLVETGPFVKTQ
jgi:hypothetical protein